MAETLLNGRYALVAQQGSGGMSVIYKAIDKSLGRTVAVKILRPSLTQDPTFLERFRNEAVAVANLSHPNIVTVHDVGNDGPTHYIVMEMVDGQDLKKIIKANGALAVDRAVNIGIQICAGIGFAHRSNLVHADVKPQNVLVTDTDVVKVTDFGIAQALSDTQPQQRADVVWGSPHYFAPEQARGEQPSPASDVYAIGIVLFEMLTGQLPYTGASQQELAMAHIREQVPMANAINPSVPESLAKIVHKVMSKEPAGRYRMADQLGHVLQSYRDRAQQHTAPNLNAPSLANSPSPPSVGALRPPTIPPAPPFSDPTVRLSVVPNAPSEFDPRRASVSAVTSPPQPFEQRYTPAPPANQPSANDSSRYSAAFPDERRAQASYEEHTGLDLVTILLALLAFIAVMGLIPLYFAVWQARAGI